MANPRLNKRQDNWLQSFLSQYPYYKVERICEGLDRDRILFMEGREIIPLPLIAEFEGASPGYRIHNLEIKLRKYGDARLSAIQKVETIYPHCNIDDKITNIERFGQLSLSLSTALEIPEPINPVIVTQKPKGKARAKSGIQLSLPVTGLEAKLFGLRQQARPHLPPVSSQELAQEKVATWSARDKQEVELPQVIVDLLLAHNADDQEWQSAIDLFPYIGLSSTISFVEGIPAFRQHLNKQSSTAKASAQVKPAALAVTTEIQQVPVSQR